MITPFGIRIKPLLSDIQLDPEKFCDFSYPETPPWTYIPPFVNLTITEFEKGHTAPEIYIGEYNRVKSLFNDFEFIYTDGSSRGDNTAAAAVKGKHIYSECLPDKTSIYSAELHAIYLALDHIETSELQKTVIFTDSKSSLEALNNRDWKHPLVQKILERLQALLASDHRVVFCWIPSHIDNAAKEALHKRVTEMPIPQSDYKRYIKSYTYSKWQLSWDKATNNKLHIFRTRKCSFLLL